MKFLLLNFLPRSSDVALLLVRLWFGATMVGLHGWGKLMSFSERSGQFMNPFGIGSAPTYTLVVFAEVVCAGLVVLGLFTRLAALICGFTMFYAFWIAHGARLTGQGNGELAFLFLGGFLTLLIAGAGRYSFDARLGAKH